MAVNPWIEGYLQSCAGGVASHPFTCGEIAGVCTGGGTCTDPNLNDYCCTGVQTIENFALVCDFFLPEALGFRLRFGQTVPLGVGQPRWWIDVENPGTGWESVYALSYSTFNFGDYCSVVYQDPCYVCLAAVCCNGCEDCMATCDDLVEKLTDTNHAIMCLAQRVDCIIEVIGQSWMDRSYVANHYANVERILVSNTNQISQALMAIAQGVSEVGIPIPELPPETTLDPLENTELGCAASVPDFCGAVPPP